MNIRQLRHFLAIVEHGSLSAAAEVVHLSTPALSRSLRALEDELGVPLFDRQDRRLQLTPYAVEYVQRARRIVFEEKEGARALATMSAGGSGLLAFGMGSATAASLLGPMLLELLQVNPGVRTVTTVQSSDSLLAALRAEKIDFFIGDVRVAETDPEFSVEAVYACTFGWFARKHHPLPVRPLTFSDLSVFPIIGAGFTDPAMGRRMAQLYDWKWPVDDQLSVTTNDHPVVLRLIAHSDAILPTADLTVMDALQAGRVRRLSVAPALDLDLTLGIIRRAGRTCTPVMEWACEYIRAHFLKVKNDVTAERSLGAME